MKEEEKTLTCSNEEGSITQLSKLSMAKVSTD
jgi:hypothetical protein